MIRINLLPEEMRPAEAVGFTLPKITINKNSLWGLAAFLALQVFFTLFVFYRSFEAGRLASETGVLKTELKEVFMQKSETERFSAKIASAQPLLKRHFYWTSILNELTATVTKGIWLRELSVLEGQESQVVKKKDKKDAKGASAEKVRYIRLEGSAMAPGQEMAFIGKFLKSLKEDAKFAELFDQIELSTINQRRVKDFDVADFTIVLVFKKGRS